MRREIQILKNRQSDTASFLRKTITEGYKEQAHGKDDIGFYSILFGQSF